MPIADPRNRSDFRDKRKQCSHKSLAHRNHSDFCDCDAHRGPQKSQRFPRQEKAMLHCDLRVRWKVASDLRFQAAISEPKNLSFCRISGDLAPSTRKSLAIAIVRFWCAKHKSFACHVLAVGVCPPPRGDRWKPLCAFPCSEGCLRDCAPCLR